jgi:hypothetical protein
VLAFSIADGDSAMFLTAYADPVDSRSREPSPGAERIWYLTSEPLTATAPGAAGSTRVMSKGGTIGDEHRAGPYRVHLLLTRRPITRAETAPGALGGDVLVTRVDDDLVVTP